LLSSIETFEKSYSDAVEIAGEKSISDRSSIPKISQN
jgi:hypothetical protein